MLGTRCLTVCVFAALLCVLGAHPQQRIVTNMGGTISSETPQEEVKAGNPISPIFPKQCGHPWWSHTRAPLLVTLQHKFNYLYTEVSRNTVLGCVHRIFGYVYSIKTPPLDFLREVRNGGSETSRANLSSVWGCRIALAFAHPSYHITRVRSLSCGTVLIAR